MIKYSLSKLVTECLGTFLITMLFMSTNSFALLAGYWIITIFSWKLSGAQFNPAITLAYVLRKDRDAAHMGWPLGFCYVGAQCAGAYLGALLMGFFNWTALPLVPGEVVGDDTDYKIFGAMMQESLGAFMLVVFYMMQSDEKMHFSNEQSINCFIIPSSYFAARAIFNGTNAVVSSPYGACCNPAIAFGIDLTAFIDEPGLSASWFWIYLALPFAGSICAFLFYEFVFKKTQQMLGHHEEEEIDDDVAKRVDEQVEEGVLDA